MRICAACKGDGARRHKGYCHCDGWCHSPRSCEDDYYLKCGPCRGRGFIGKINVSCPVCGVVKNRACKEIKGYAKWYRPLFFGSLPKYQQIAIKKQIKIHQRRRTQALNLCKKKARQVELEAERKAKAKQLKTLKKQLKEFEEVKKTQKAMLRLQIRNLEARLKRKVGVR